MHVKPTPREVWEYYKDRIAVFDERQTVLLPVPRPVPSMRDIRAGQLYSFVDERYAYTFESMFWVQEGEKYYWFNVLHDGKIVGIKFIHN